MDKSNSFHGHVSREDVQKGIKVRTWEKGSETNSEAPFGPFGYWFRTPFPSQHLSETTFRVGPRPES